VNELQLAAMAVGGLVTGIGALATTVKVMASRRNGHASNGHSPPCDELVDVLRSQAKQNTEIAVIQANQENNRKSLDRIERNVGTLVDGLLHKTDPDMKRRTE